MRKYRPTTTQSAHAHAPSPDLLERDFTADGPNKKWLCDIAYIPTDEGFLYLSGVMDAWSRSIVGWSMSNTLHATIATDALTMAVKRRSPPIGLVHHGDRGVQYACHACRELLEEHGAEHGPCWQLLRQRHDGKPLGDPEEGTGPRPAFPHA
jgi:putative transposase